MRLNDPPNGVELDAVKSYDSKVKRSVTCWGWGWPRERSEPECNGGGSFVVLGSQTCYTIHGPFRDIATRREANRAFSDFN